jgi:hypothetical protein
MKSANFVKPCGATVKLTSGPLTIECTNWGIEPGIFLLEIDPGHQNLVLVDKRHR